MMAWNIWSAKPETVPRITPCILAYLCKTGETYAGWRLVRLQNFTNTDVLSEFLFHFVFCHASDTECYKTAKMDRLPSSLRLELCRIIVSRVLATYFLCATSCSVILNSSERHLTFRYLKYIYWPFRDLFSCFRKINICTRRIGYAVAQLVEALSADSIPDYVIGTFHRHNPSGRTMALSSTQPVTEMSVWNISWG
jgi:hypothetical protein